MMKNMLFLCSQNKLRSPTAHAVFAAYDGFEVRSAGLDRDAVVPVTAKLIEWADCIFVMEKTHKNKLQKKYRKHLNKQQIICLDIPDEYEFMENSLIGILKNRAGRFFH